MHIETISIENYKSFFEKQTLSLQRGFNLLVGTNNAGKTSVLDAIDLNPALGEPHRSVRSIPEYGREPVAQSKFEVTIATQYSELRQLVGDNNILFPVTSFDPFHMGLNREEYVRSFVDSDGFLKLTAMFGSGMTAVSIYANDLIRGVASTQNGNPVPACRVVYDPSSPAPLIQFITASLNESPGNYSQYCRSRVYRFSAQRRPGFKCSALENSTLDREATSLPYCINHLQTNDAHGHKILCEWVNRVFPSVKWIQATPVGSHFELRCLPHLPSARRSDLMVPIEKMGAGIGNVIAMFYVVLTARFPQVIAIDEPNAFLHPRALRELLCILETEGKEHQFILTAHSADVLTAVNAKSISLLDFDGTTTAIQQVEAKNFHLIRSELAALGIRITDLHAKDRVVWVEGQTEELVMPELLKWACPEIAAGTSVLRVERTGTFDKKSIEPEEVANIYERLSTSSALVPPMMCILLDGESRTLEKRQKIEATSSGKLRFLSRRMLENYLLHSSALNAVLSELGCKLKPELVSDALSKEVESVNINELDGAAVLARTISSLSKATLEFRKTRDVPTLVSWILENDPDFLNPLGECLRKTLGVDAASQERNYN